MKTIYYNTFILLLMLIALGCQKQFVSLDPTDIDEGVGQLSEFDQPQELPQPEVLDQTEPMTDPDNDAYECYSTTYRAAPGFDELLAMDPTTDVIYPGAMLQGSSIPTGEYIPITADRAPITLSISLQNLSGSPVVEIEDPKVSTVREGLKTILDQEVESATPAKINFSIEQVYSEEHVNLALGANYRSAGSGVQSSFDFNSSQYKNKFVLKYLQVYYTIDMDPPENPSDLFNNLSEVSDLGQTTPVYVASMAYGRMVLYTIESNRSETDINSAFNATFASSDGSVSAEHQEVIEESSVKALVIGGSGASAANVVRGPSEVYNFIAEGGKYSKDSPGAPLSYKMRFIKKGTPVARVVLSSEYQVRECVFTSPTYKMEIDYLKCNDCPEVGDAEIYGDLKAQAFVDETAIEPYVEWSKNRDNAISVEQKKAHNLGLSKNVELFKPNYNTDYIKLTGKLYERDLSFDDDLGEAEESIILKDVDLGASVSKVLKFGQEAEVNFIITRIE